jgi:Fe2+ transport system protein FeoA
MQIPDYDSLVSSWLETNGIFPGVKLIIESRDDFDGGINCKIDNNEVRISSSIASLVKVSQED